MSWDEFKEPPEEGAATADVPKVLIPVQVLEGETVPEPIVEFLAPTDVVVLGYHVLPDQTPTEQGSLQFEDRARDAVEDIAEAFRENVGSVETRVVFTHDRNQTVDRIGAEVDATAVLLANPTGEISDVLVAVRGSVDVDRLADLVSSLTVNRDGHVTVWGLGGGPFDVETAVQLADARLRERGLAPDRITVETSDSETPIYDIVDRSDEFDAIVMGEGGPPVLSALFGDDAERVAEGSVAPVLVVRGEPEEPGEDPPDDEGESADVDESVPVDGAGTDEAVDGAGTDEADK